MRRSSARAAIAAGALVAASATLSQTGETRAFEEADFELFTGILPNGEFGFALEVIEATGGIEGQPAFAPGTFVTRVQVNRPEEGLATQGQQEMLDLLASIGPGDTAFIEIVEPDGAVPDRITFALMSEQERRARARAAVREQLLLDQAGLANESRRAGDPYGESYWGTRLRHMELGNFEMLRALIDAEAEGMEDFLEQFTGEGMGFLPRVVGTLMRLEGRAKPYAGLIAGYAIARASILGSCGEPMRELTQTTEVWTEYRNGFGTTTGTSSSTFSTKAVAVPERFASVVMASGDVENNFLETLNLSPVLRALSCEDPRRTRLEENMLAFYLGRSPASRGLQ